MLVAALVSHPSCMVAALVDSHVCGAVDIIIMTMTQR